MSFLHALLLTELINDWDATWRLNFGYPYIMSVLMVFGLRLFSSREGEMGFEAFVVLERFISQTVIIKQGLQEH